MTPRFESSRCAHTEKCAATRAATNRKRRNQPRTVDTGRSTEAAILRCPAPPAAAVNAFPITPAVSTRLRKPTSGNNTCVDLHERQRARRGRTTTGIDSPRNLRRRANDHRARDPPQPGQGTNPAARSASTRAGSFPTMSMMPSGITGRTPSQLSQEDSEGVLARTGPPHAVATTPTPQARQHPTNIPTLCVARPPYRPKRACRSTGVVAPFDHRATAPARQSPRGTPLRGTGAGVAGRSGDP
jgi:hypothetical protein